LELTLARLAKLVGGANIGSPELLDTHRPDAFRINRFELKERTANGKRRTARQQAGSEQRTANGRQQAGSEQRTANGRQEVNGNSKFQIPNSKFTLGFRVFRPPLRAIVQLEKGCPREISAWDKNRSVYGKVISVAGPWRTSGDWWRSDFWARDEWDIGVESGSKFGVTSHPVLYRIYRELRSMEWFVEGIYD
jgi:protein ImuB